MPPASPPTAGAGLEVSGHTAGPWALHAEGLRGGRYWVVTISPEFETVDIHEDENGEANARLIAAAPTMADYIAKRAAAGDAEAAEIMEAIHGHA